MKQSIKLTALIVVILMALGVLLGSCSDDDSNDPMVARVQLTMKATASNSEIVKSGRTANTQLTLREVLLGVTELEFEKLDDDDDNDDEEEDDNNDRRGNDDDDENGDDDDDEIEFEGHFVVDLINGTSTPDFGIANIIPGVYEEIELEMEPILEGGNTIFVLLEYLPDGATEPYVIEYTNSEELEVEFERDSGFRLDGGTLSQFLVLLDLDELFSGVDFSSADTDDDGTIRINANSNSSLAAKIRANLYKALDAGEDDDGDDDIDDD